MATATPLKINTSAPGIAQFTGTDTVPPANLPVMVGDSGSGGVQGAVPAPAAGDAAAGKYLKADGTWATAGGGSTPNVIAPSSVTADQDDYNPTGWSTADVVLLTFGTAFPAITSFAAAATSGATKWLINTGTNPGYIPCEHPDGTAANRVAGGQDFILDSHGAIQILYDGTNSRWRVVQNTFNAALLPIKGKGHMYQESAGATNASSFPSLNFSTTGGANGALGASTTLPAAWGLQVSAVNNAAGINWTRTGNEITAFGSAHLSAYTLLSINVLSTSAQRFQVDFSITASPATNTAAINNSVGIRYRDDVNSGKWLLFSRDSGGTETTADSGVTVSANTLYQLAVFYDKSRTEARFYINETFVGRITANQPSAAVCSPRLNIIKTVGTSARDIWIHTFGAYSIYI